MLNLHVIIVSFIVGLIVAFVYEPYFSAMFTYCTSRSHLALPQRISAMQTLVKSPGIGQFFYEELVEELAFQQEWNKVLNYTT